MVDLPGLCEKLQDAGLLHKSFMECTRSEILQVVTAVFSSVGDDVPADGWNKPYLKDMPDSTQVLVIPFDSHPKYRWWTTEGQCISETLKELDAPYAVAKCYLENLSEEEWLSKIIPF